MNRIPLHPPSAQAELSGCPGLSPPGLSALWPAVSIIEEFNYDITLQEAR
jgi:hypothetical protein